MSDYIYCLYGLYSPAGALFYVGVTRKLYDRKCTHNGDKRFIPYRPFQMRVLKRFTEKQDAMLAETKLIIAAKHKGLLPFNHGSSHTLSHLSGEKGTPYTIHLENMRSRQQYHLYTKHVEERRRRRAQLWGESI